MRLRSGTIIASLELMPRRKEYLATGGIYHVLNRFIHSIPYLGKKKNCEYFLNAMFYYLQVKPPIKFSVYRSKNDYFVLNYSIKLVTIINYCLMPTHFHLTLRQEVDNGIQFFTQRVSNSFSHYINTKEESKGTIFEGSFKAIRVEGNEQLLHLSRYIHLNPVSSYITDKPEKYVYSSYKNYLGLEKSEFTDPSLVLGSFPSINKYEEFVLNQIDYQRSLEKCKYLILE